MEQMIQKPEDNLRVGEVDFYLDMLFKCTYQFWKWKQKLAEEPDNPYAKQQKDKYVAKIHSFRYKIKRIINNYEIRCKYNL